MDECNGSKAAQDTQQTSEQAGGHLLSRWFAEPIFSTLKMEAICSSETSVETQRTTWLHSPEDGNLHNHSCENLESYTLEIVSDLQKFHNTLCNPRLSISVTCFSLFSFPIAGT
jgi:hypothetical protein